MRVQYSVATMPGTAGSGHTGTAMGRGRILLWLLLAIVAWPAAAGLPETPRFRVVGVSQGMPSTEINDIARDRDGYIWLATADGLARYDGVGTRVWRHDPDDPGSLPHNYVQLVHVDAGNRVWVATEGAGISVLDRDSGQFHNYQRARYPEIDDDNVIALTHLGQDIWFGTYGGAVHRLAPDGSITRFSRDSGRADGLSGSLVLALTPGPSGELWIGTFGGLAVHDGTRVRAEPLPGDEPHPRVYSVSRVDDEIWVGTSAGVFARAADGQWSQPHWSPMFESPNNITALARDSRGGMWIATSRSLWRARPGQVPVPVETGARVTGRPVMSLLLQSDDALWVPLFGEGLGYLRSDWRQVAQFSASADGLSGDSYRALGPARDGGVWLGGHNGSLEWLGPDGSVERFDAPVRTRLRGERLFAVAEDQAGALWLGSREGLLRLSPSGALDRWQSDDARDAAPPGWVDWIRIGADGSVWLSARGGGVQKRDSATGRVLTQVLAGPDSGLNIGDVEQLEIAPDGAVWVAGAEGLSVFDADSGVFRLVPSTRGSRAFAFAFDGADVVWLQRISGLERHERGPDGRWRRSGGAGVREGLPAVGAQGLQVDAARRVWVSTVRGLYRWDPGARQLRHYGVQHGFSSQEFIDRAMVLGESGMLVASTVDGGVTMVDTRAADPPPQTPSLHLDALEVRRNGEWQPVALASPVELAPHTREFRVRARLLAYDDPASNRYWSKLDGVDGEWVAQGASGERVLSGLSPGRYTLQLRAADAAGTEAPGYRLEVVLRPPWWRTGPAYALVALIVLAVLGWLAMLYRARLRRRSELQLMRHKQALAEQASLAKTRFLATLGHEVRTPMTGVMGMTELLLRTGLDVRQRGYVESVRRAGEHLMRLVNDALDLARIEAGKLDLVSQPFDLRALLRDVTGLMAPVAQDRGLEFREHVDANAPGWLTGDVVRVRQVLLNLLGNAIKFTEAGFVELRVEPLDPGVRLVVADSGPGLNEEQKERLFRRFEQGEGARTAARYGGSGLGLAICQELAAEMGGRIRLESAPGEGSRFIVELPLPQADPMPDPSDGGSAGDRDCTPPRQVLLVEDDTTIARVIVELLQVQGHEVTHVAHGLAALGALSDGRFDLALLDLDLPGIDGFALARQMRCQGFACPLVAITARADAEAEPLARAAGFDAFLRKPLTGEMLARAVAMPALRKEA